MKTKFNLLLWFLILFVGRLHAQSDFRSGYIINHSQDTLVGEIDYRNQLVMGQVCTFKDRSGKTIKYTPTEILGYRFTDDKFFVARTVDGQSLFLEFLFKGKVNIYSSRDSIGDGYYIEKEDIKIKRIPFEEGTREIDGVSYLYQSKSHIGMLNHFMQDATPKVKAMISSIKKPNYNNLVKLAKAYHESFSKTEPYYTFEKKRKVIQISWELQGGIADFTKLNDIVDKNYFQGGLITNFQLSRSNEKFSFRTGILFFNLDSESTENSKTTILKFPIQFEYTYPKFFIRPKIAVGVNIYHPFYQSVSLMGGFNLKISDSIFGSVNYDLDFRPNESVPIIPSGFFSKYLSLGVIFKPN